MRLNAKMLKNVSNVNHWEYADSVYVQQGQVSDFYLQLVDLDKIHKAEKSKVNPDFPLRYIPQGTTVTLTVTFPNIDNTLQQTLNASQPFSDDKSIWQITIPSLVDISSGSIEITLTEDGVAKTFILQNALRVENNNIGGC